MAGRALFLGPNLARSVVLTGAVAIHALSLRVVVTVLPLAVIEIGGLRFFAWTMTVAMISAIWGAASAAPLAHLARASSCLPHRSRAVRGRQHHLRPFLRHGFFSRRAAVPRSGRRSSDRARLHDDLAGLSKTPAYARYSHLVHGLEHCRSDRAADRWRSRGMGHWRWAFWVDVPLAAAVGVVAQRTILTRTGETVSRPTGAASIALGRLTFSAGRYWRSRSADCPGAH